MTSPWFRDYEIISRLRTGGMASLCLAHRHGPAAFSRLVALRLIRPNLVIQAGFLQSFVDEHDRSARPRSDAVRWPDITVSASARDLAAKCRRPEER